MDNCTGQSCFYKPFYEQSGKGKVWDMAEEYGCHRDHQFPVVLTLKFRPITKLLYSLGLLVFWGRRENINIHSPKCYWTK